jgi:hypothetical protein
VPRRNLIIPSMPLKSLKFLMCHPFYVSFLLCRSVQLRLLSIVIFFTNDCLPSSRETASVSLPTNAATSGGSATAARRTFLGPSSSSSLLSTPASSHQRQCLPLQRPFLAARARVAEPTEADAVGGRQRHGRRVSCPGCIRGAG